MNTQSGERSLPARTGSPGFSKKTATAGGQSEEPASSSPSSPVISQTLEEVKMNPNRNDELAVSSSSSTATSQTLEAYASRLLDAVTTPPMKRRKMKEEAAAVNQLKQISSGEVETVCRDTQVLVSVSGPNTAVPATPTPEAISISATEKQWVKTTKNEDRRSRSLSGGLSNIEIKPPTNTIRGMDYGPSLVPAPNAGQSRRNRASKRKRDLSDHIRGTQALLREQGFTFEPFVLAGLNDGPRRSMSSLMEGTRDLLRQQGFTFERYIWADWDKEDDDAAS